MLTQGLTCSKVHSTSTWNTAWRGCWPPGPKAWWDRRVEAVEVTDWCSEWERVFVFRYNTHTCCFLTRCFCDSVQNQMDWASFWPGAHSFLPPSSEEGRAGSWGCKNLAPSDSLSFRGPPPPVPIWLRPTSLPPSCHTATVSTSWLHPAPRKTSYLWVLDIARLQCASDLDYLCFERFYGGKKQAVSQFSCRRTVRPPHLPQHPPRHPHPQHPCLDQRGASRTGGAREPSRFKASYPRTDSASCVGVLDRNCFFGASNLK